MLISIVLKKLRHISLLPDFYHSSLYGSTRTECKEEGTELVSEIVKTTLPGLSADIYVIVAGTGEALDETNPTEMNSPYKLEVPIPHTSHQNSTETGSYHLTPISRLPGARILTCQSSVILHWWGSSKMEGKRCRKGDAEAYASPRLLWCFTYELPDSDRRVE